MKSQLEKDSSRAMSELEEDGSDPIQNQDLVHQIGEAMEEIESLVAQANQAEEEGDVGNTALPLKSKQVEEDHYVGENTLTNSLLKGLINNGGNTPLDDPRNDDVTNPRQGRVVGNTATLPSVTEQGKVVGNTTTVPNGTGYGGTMENTVVPPTTMSMEERIEQLNLVEKTINQLVKESKELEYTGCYALMTQDMEIATSPTTSTPSSTPSPNR